MARLTANGVTLCYEQVGSGPPLLLISGLGANRLSWAPVLPLVCDAFRCTTFDNRGVGESDVPPGPYTIAQMADDAAMLIEALGVAPVLAVGWSMGGSILQSLLIRYGHLIRRAVLLSTLPCYTAVQHGWLNAQLSLRRSGLAPLTIGIAGMPWSFTARLLSDHRRALAAAQLRAQNPYPTSVAGFEAQAQAVRTYDSRSQLPTVTTPTLVLVGAEDVLTPMSQVIEMAKLIPASRLTVLPRGGHAMVIEYPEDTVSAIRSSLTDDASGS